MSTGTDRLYNLMPVIYRRRDLPQGEPLRALLAVLEREIRAIEADMNGLYQNWFIETCDEWVVPYIGDLLGVKGLHAGSTGTFSLRAYVANTLAYRRRKGTAMMLEQLARDVTGWNARAVEFFDLLATTQNLNHFRPHNQQAPDLRRGNQLELLDTAFDPIAHAVDVRHIANNRAKHNILNVGLFLWRLQAYPVRGVPASEAGEGLYHFSSLGCDTPLFNQPQTETEITHLAEEVNVPGRLRRRALYDELEAHRQALVDDRIPQAIYFGEPPVLEVFVNGDPIPPKEILISDLSDWQLPKTVKTYTKSDDVTVEVARDIKVAVDPALGRLALPGGEGLDDVRVNYQYGFSADIGGGPYSRHVTLARSSTDTWNATVAKDDPDADFTSLSAALDAWVNRDKDEDKKNSAVITITDDDSYVEKISIPLAEDQWIVIQADSRKRPILRFVDAAENLANLEITGSDGRNAGLTLNGLLVEGGIHVKGDSLAQLCITHSTLVPGRKLDSNGNPRHPELASVMVGSPNAGLTVEIDHSIVGALCLPTGMSGLYVRDSIIDSPAKEGRARYVPVVVSASLSSFPTLSSDTPTVNVTIGNEGPYPAALPEKPTTLAQARDQLQEAIRTAHSSRAFREARVATAQQRLIIVPGALGTMTITTADPDPTATELKLDSSSARQVSALLSDSLSSFPELSSGAPALYVLMGTEGPYEAILASVPASLVQARDQLQTAIRGAHTTPAFTSAIVASLDDQLVVVPGTDRTAMVFSKAPSDQTTLTELALDTVQPAIADSQDLDQPGPITRLERTTVFGTVYVREMALASEAIFTAPIKAQRQQAGCIRYSYVPEGSQTPRRYSCQPDLALVEQAKRLGLGSAEDLAVSEKESTLTRLRPVFTSTCYSDPGYAQLGSRCAEEIATGAEDGSELGVFSYLKQPQREANLRASLDDYLRFGLEAGIFYVT